MTTHLQLGSVTIFGGVISDNDNNNHITSDVAKKYHSDRYRKPRKG